MVTVRPMTHADLPDVMILEHALFPEDAWSEGTLRGELAEQPATRHYVVALDEGEIVGYAGLLAVGGEGDVQTIGVRADRQGAGVRAVLLSAPLRAVARRDGPPGVSE